MTGRPRADCRCWEGRHDDGGPATCMLPDEHEGPHEWTPDAEITVSFGRLEQVGWVQAPDDFLTTRIEPSGFDQREPVYRLRPKRPDNTGGTRG